MITTLQKKILKKWDNFDREPVKKHHRKRPCIPLSLRVRVWKKYNGNSMRGRCWLCRRDLSFSDCEIGHKQAFCENGDTDIENLVPIHGRCNREMSRCNADEYKRRYYPRKKRF